MVKEDKLIYFACELICLSMLCILDRYLLSGDILIRNYYTTYYDSAFFIWYFTPALIGVSIIIHAFNTNGKMVSLAFIVPGSIIMAIILFIYGISSMDTISFNYFLQSYFVYLIFLSILWAINYSAHKFINLKY